MTSPLPDPFPTNPPGAFRLIHTADWHLGKPLGHLDRTEEYRRFLQWLGETIRATRADALLVSGDIFDSATPPQSAVRLYYDFLAALPETAPGCSVLILGGNHDSPGHLEAPRHLLRRVNCEVIATLPPGKIPLIPLPDAKAPRLLVAALPFLRERDLRRGEPGQSADVIRQQLHDGLCHQYQRAAEAAAPWKARGIPLLATGHLTALGACASDSEREIHVGGLGALSASAFPPLFDYIALGHLHRPQAVGGNETIRYSGSPLTLSFSEARDRKEIRLLDFAEGRLFAQTAIPVPQPRFLQRLHLHGPDWPDALRAHTPPPAPLPAWVELTLSTPGADLYRQVQEVARPLPFEVIRVLTIVPNPRETASFSPAPDENLLADPRSVFTRRLEIEPLPPELRQRLLTAFDELHSLHQTPRE